MPCTAVLELGQLGEGMGCYCWELVQAAELGEQDTTLLACLPLQAAAPHFGSGIFCLLLVAKWKEQ